MIAQVTKVFPEGEKFVFFGKLDKEQKYESNSKKDANRGRALLIKQIKSKGFKVLCV